MSLTKNLSAHLYLVLYVNKASLGDRKYNIVWGRGVIIVGVRGEICLGFAHYACYKGQPHNHTYFFSQDSSQLELVEVIVVQ